MPLDGVKHLLLVLSGKGGVGKSSATLQLALTLSLQGKSVGILDIDLTGPSIPRLVGLEDAKIKQSPQGWLPVPVHPALPAEPKDANGDTETSAASETGEIRGSFRCMSLGFLIRERSDAVIWRGPKKTAMIRQFMDDVFWGDTDYLLVDTPPGTGDEHIGLAESLLTLASTDPAVASEQKIPHLAGAVLITTPQAVATSDVRKEVNFCVKTSIPALGVIENMCGYACPCCGEVTNVFSSGGGEVMAKEMGVRFLGRVPVDVKFGAMVEGKPDNISDEDENEAENNGAGSEAEHKDSEEADDRPLVEKYKECWSYSRYEAFAKELISIIEGDGKSG